MNVRMGWETQRTDQGGIVIIPLNPCPFCGSNAHVVTAFATVTYVQCTNKQCNAIIQVDGADRVQAVMQRWNRRA